MRILHTSDWHLGKSIYGQNLLEDQDHTLKELVREINGGYDAVLISGDIYDRGIPPSGAVELFSWFIEKMVEKKVPVVIIPGNHDSPARLDFASGVLEKNGVHFRCGYDRLTDPVIIEDAQENIAEIFALPFVDEITVKSRFSEAGIRTHQEATEYLLDEIRKVKDPESISILMAHSYTGKKAYRSDSERELLVGNQGFVESEIFRGFDYVAMGHLHRPQTASKSNNIIYSGSLIPYSFSESGHTKSSVSLEFDGDDMNIRRIPHKLRRNFSVLEDSMKNLTEDERYSGYRDHYLSVSLTDSGLLVDIHKRLMERFPHVLEIDQPALHIETDGPENISREDADDPARLFSLFLDRFQWKENRERAMEIFHEIRKEIERREVNS